MGQQAALPFLSLEISVAISSLVTRNIKNYFVLGLLNNLEASFEQLGITLDRLLPIFEK